MVRRNFLKGFSLLGVSGAITPMLVDARDMNDKEPAQINDRQYWINMLTQIATPVLQAAHDDSIKERMPIECRNGTLSTRVEVTHLEALGRTLAGIAPWL
jgi:hypothetical protein